MRKEGGGRREGHGCREVEVPLGSLGPTDLDQETLQKVPDVQELTGGLFMLLLVFLIMLLLLLVSFELFLQPFFFLVVARVEGARVSWLQPACVPHYQVINQLLKPFINLSNI